MKILQTSCGCGCSVSRSAAGGEDWNGGRTADGPERERMAGVSEGEGTTGGPGAARTAHGPEGGRAADSPAGEHRVASPAGQHAESHPVSRAGMVRLPGGAFRMGTDAREGFPQDGEGPSREVTVSPFYLDACAVTNEQFQTFVRETGYVTEAEQYGWSFVFHLFVPEPLRAQVDMVVDSAPWWWKVDGAAWHSPEGPGSDVSQRLDHPVVHVSWHDADAYARWAGKRLPTEAEWEYAARGGLTGMRYPWGDELLPEGRHQCNIWQGAFPHTNSELDGYAGTAPADSFPPNGYGLHHMAGNVWEWCADWFTPDYHRTQPDHNPGGPEHGVTKTLKGGSYLCHSSYCNRYRTAARTSNTPDSSTGHMGFRCAADAAGQPGSPREGNSWEIRV